jgi:hypothetical protein
MDELNWKAAAAKQAPVRIAPAAAVAVKAKKAA